MLCCKKRYYKYAIFVCLLFGLINISAEGFLTPDKMNTIKKRYGQAAYERVQQWMLLLNQKKITNDADKLKLVNDFLIKQRLSAIVSIGKSRTTGQHH